MAARHSNEHMMGSKNRAGLIFSASLLSGALALTGCGSVGSTNSTASGDGGKHAVTIGLLAPITGPVSPEGKALKAGFELGIDKVNQNGGIFGEPVKVVFADGKADPATATQFARKFFTQDHVDYLVGTITGDTAAAVGRASTEAQVPFSPAILGDSGYCGKYFWPFGETDYALQKDLIPYMVKKFGPKVALVGNDYVFPREFNKTAKTLLDAAGGKAVAEVYAPLGTSDWQPVLQKLRSARPDWILTSVVGGDAISFTQQAHSFGLLKDIGITGVSLNQEFYPALAALDNGRQMTERYTDQLGGQENAKFVKQYRDKTGSTDPVPSVAANAYVGAQFIAAAFKKAGSAEGSAVVKALSSLSLEDTIVGHAEFNAENHTFHTDMYLVTIKAGGKYVPIRSLGVVVDKEKRQCS